MNQISEFFKRKENEPKREMENNNSQIDNSILFDDKNLEVSTIKNIPQLKRKSEICNDTKMLILLNF